MLLILSPLIRGGNRQVALIVIDVLALAVCLSWAVAGLRSADGNHHRPGRLHWLLLLAPAWVAVVQLTPLPPAVWLALPGRAIYADVLAAIGVAPGWRPVSLMPDATVVSLLAGISVSAAFLLGLQADHRQARQLLLAIVAVALGQVGLSLGQVAGGTSSALFLGVQSYGPPVGTFANRNHLANYLALALAMSIWLGYEHLRRRAQAPAESAGWGRLSALHLRLLWGAVALALTLGILLSRSRGAALFGLPAALACLCVVSAPHRAPWWHAWRAVVPAALGLLVVSAVMIGLDAVTSRLSTDQLASSASFRGMLARSSLDGALALFPWGAGWGTYEWVYPQFQPRSLAGLANHAHQDYAELLFEGGALALLLAAAFAWLAVRRVHELWRARSERGWLGGHGRQSVVCGLALLGFLLHSLVDFSMRIPANAILAAFIAGLFLRPLPVAMPTRHRGEPA